LYFGVSRIILVYEFHGLRIYFTTKRAESQQFQEFSVNKQTLINDLRRLRYYIMILTNYKSHPAFCKWFHLWWCRSMRGMWVL